MFINETLRDYCRDAGIVFTRCRPWRKNDQAFVERKNGAVVRRIVGYRRLEGLEAAAALSRLYATTRLYVNFFQPSFKLASKRRDGARVGKRHHAPATPSQRPPRRPQDACERVAELAATPDPIRLLRQMRVHRQRVVDIADRPVAEPQDATVPPLEQFLAGLRTAWAEGEARPTARPPAKPKRGRRRPDPLVKVTEQLHAWFEAEPWSTGGQLLERLQAASGRVPGRPPAHRAAAREGLAQGEGDSDGVRRVAGRGVGRRRGIEPWNRGRVAGNVAGLAVSRRWRASFASLRPFG